MFLVDTTVAGVRELILTPQAKTGEAAVLAALDELKRQNQHIGGGSVLRVVELADTCEAHRLRSLCEEANQ